MLSALSKAYIAYAVVGAVVAVAYIFGTGGDHMGGTLLVTLSVAGLAFAAAASMRVVVDTDLEVPVAADAPPPASHPVADPGPSVRPSLFPFGAAVGLTLLGVGITTDTGVLVLGAALVAIGVAGWLALSWREHPLWTARFGQRVGQRAVGPFSYPVVALIVGALVAFSISRFYLAIAEKAAVVVSVAAAALVLGLAAILASGKNVGQRLLTAVSGVALLSVVGSGVAGYATGERHIETHEPGYHDVEIEAEGIAYDKTHLAVPEGRVKLTFVNKDPGGTVHDVGVYSLPPAGTDPKEFVPGKPFVAVLPIDGGRKASALIDTTVVGLEVGSEYLYRCDFHPAMKGTLTVVPAPAHDAEKGAAKE
jgi:plastocyanin